MIIATSAIADISFVIFSILNKRPLSSVKQKEEPLWLFCTWILSFLYKKIEMDYLIYTMQTFLRILQKIIWHESMKILIHTHAC